MNITLKEITIRELAENYSEDAGTGRVCGFGGKLDIRPIYQREFVYKESQRNAVIDTVFKAFPLNVMYWADRARSFPALKNVPFGRERVIFKKKNFYKHGKHYFFTGDLRTREGDRIESGNARKSG